MLKRFPQTKWLFPMAVLLLLAALALGVRLTYSAYIHRSYVKAVIATNETEKLFGSNLLYGVKNEPAHPEEESWMSVSPYVVLEGTSETITIPVKIYNYLADDPDRINQLDVNYTISFKVTGSPTKGSLEGYSICGVSGLQLDTVYHRTADGLSENAEEAAVQYLPGRVGSKLEYQITVPRADLGKISIAVKATRTEVGGKVGTDLLYLAARIVPSVNAIVTTASVEGAFLESRSPADYAAYNYRITLSGAATTVVLSWNPDLLEIDPFFEQKHGVAPGSSSVTFPMDPGILTVQFYQKGIVTDETAWSDFCIQLREK